MTNKTCETCRHYGAEFSVCLFGKRPEVPRDLATERVYSPSDSCPKWDPERESQVFDLPTYEAFKEFRKGEGSLALRGKNFTLRLENRAHMGDLWTDLTHAMNLLLTHELRLFEE